MKERTKIWPVGSLSWLPWDEYEPAKDCDVWLKFPSGAVKLAVWYAPGWERRSEFGQITWVEPYLGTDQPTHWRHATRPNP